MSRLRSWRHSFTVGAIKAIPPAIFSAWFARRMYRLGVADGWRESVDQSACCQADGDCPVEPRRSKA